MKNLIYSLIILLSLISCDQNKIIEKSLENESFSFFKRHKIDTIGFKKKYYIKENKSVGYKHNILKYYKIIDKDSIIIWFTRDDEAEYFVEGNGNFYRYYMNKDTIK